MSPRTDQRRTGPLLAIFGDPWRKLLSIGLAFGLWIYLDRQITQDASVNLELPITIAANQGLDSGTLRVAIDRSDYFVAGYFDGRVNAEISGLELTLVGKKGLIEARAENTGFSVTPLITPMPGLRRSVEFTIRDIRANVPKFQALLERATMSPAIVRIELIKNTRRNIPLVPERVTINASSEVKSRLMIDNAVFSPAAVPLVGPVDKLDDARRAAIFVAEIPAFDPFDTEVTATLTLSEAMRKDNVRFDELLGITMTIPLRIDWQQLSATVPYLVDTMSLEPKDRDLFEPTAESATIEIQVSQGLQLHLLGMNDADQQRWIRDHARLWVQLSPDDVTQREITRDAQFRLIDPSYKRDVDFRVFDSKPLRLRRKE